MGYRVLEVPLDALIDAQLLVDQSQEIAEVSVPEVDAGSWFAIRFGLRNDFIGVRSPVAYEVSGDESVNGLYLRNTVAQPGLVAHILVSFADSKAPDNAVVPGTPGQVRGRPPGPVVW